MGLGLCSHLVLIAVLLGGTFAEYYGPCLREWNDELLWSYEVRRSPKAGSAQVAEAEYGPAPIVISCIDIESMLPEDNMTAWLTRGGVGKNFVTLKFGSRYDRGLHYRVSVYGSKAFK
ncbi:uncharacterized protein LOC105703324 [Orussus abietinus]|uniref:uncharacterized protein LOC105703324 n=1 Tax=Orussus abietinus TaxID=222816 RepID=UPI0006256749|nr:uncharacterized protein LOC105703324 [Orussus abietinus]